MLLLWLDDPQATDPMLTGGKAARLAELRQAGLPVPGGFVLTTHAFRAGMSAAVASALTGGYRALVAQGGPVVAVRSSATAEDMAAASFAGVQQSVLGVSDEATLAKAVAQVWASLAAPEATAYRAHAGLHDSVMAVLIQQQVAATVAGVAFARDPLSGEEVVVVEAVAGLGEALLSGQAEPQRWRLRPDGSFLEGPRTPLLHAAALRQLSALLHAANLRFGGPQDVEWASDGEQMWLLQSRPITGRQEDWFTERLPNDHHLWGAAFLNERFTQPVSPLGWTRVAGHLERLALHAPLALLGAGTLEGPMLKRWRGHPYSRVEAWQRLYKLFPAPLLPDDAARFFPEGDLSLRHAPRLPQWGPHLIANGLRLLRHEGRAAWPLSNPAAWRRYEQRQAALMIRLRFEEQRLAAQPDPIAAARALLRQSDALTTDLLTLHRWSLLWADLSYSLLRRLLRWRSGAEAGNARAAQLAAGVATPTTHMNRALAGLGRWAARDDALRADLQRLGAGEQVAPTTATLAFHAALDQFVARYGHRFLSLDLYDAPWEADRSALARFLLALGEGEAATRSTGPLPSQPPNALLRLAQTYLYLREAQRFCWQGLLALERRVVLAMGTQWAAQGALAAAEDVFGLTWEQLLAGEPDGERAAARMAHFQRLRVQARLAPGWHYPDFLRGNRPLHSALGGHRLAGRPVSPGVARGPARLVAHPEELVRLRPGDILVTTSPDPGWTPAFEVVAAMVSERGGQLSHGAVVAREYGLPAVSGIPGLLRLIKEGEPLLVDGTQGIVLRESVTP